MPIFIIFIVVPFIELALFASVSEHIGIWTTLSLAFLTAIIGGALVKHQGLQTMLSMRSQTQAGAIPLNEIFDGFCIVAAGALLITPGFLTDFIGFSLLIPPIRTALKKAIKEHTSWAVSSTTMNTGKAKDPNIIEGEYEEIDPNNAPHDKLN